MHGIWWRRRLHGALPCRKAGEIFRLDFASSTTAARLLSLLSASRSIQKGNRQPGARARELKRRCKQPSILAVGAEPCAHSTLRRCSPKGAPNGTHARGGWRETRAEKGTRRTTHRALPRSLPPTGPRSWHSRHWTLAKAIGPFPN